MLHRYLHRNRALRFLGPKRLFGFAQRLESFRSLNSRERPLFLQERTIESLVWVTEAGRLEPDAARTASGSLAGPDPPIPVIPEPPPSRASARRARDMPRIGSVGDSCRHFSRHLVDPGSRVV